MNSDSGVYYVMNKNNDIEAVCDSYEEAVRFITNRKDEELAIYDELLNRLA